MLFMMSTLDYSGLVQAIIDFFTVFLVTIPTQFITATLNGGVIFNLWTAFFGNAHIIEMIFLFIVIGGPLLMAYGWNKGPKASLNHKGSKL